MLLISGSMSLIYFVMYCRKGLNLSGLPRTCPNLSAFAISSYLTLHGNWYENKLKYPCKKVWFFYINSYLQILIMLLSYPLSIFCLIRLCLWIIFILFLILALRNLPSIPLSVWSTWQQIFLAIQLHFLRKLDIGLVKIADLDWKNLQASLKPLPQILPSLNDIKKLIYFLVKPSI